MTANIADKFGKASIDTHYGVATTVKTQRNVGVTVLEGYDIGTFPIDTPVYFLTYKKTTDPVTGNISVSNVTSWKAIVNPDNNTLTNLTLAPGYTDIGNDQGDFIEPVSTSFWANSMVGALLTSHAPNGDLLTAAVQKALNTSSTSSPDWTLLANTPVLNASLGQREYQLKFIGVDYTDRIQPGTKLKIPRTSTPPTQSMSFTAASSQYASKASPAGLTFTTAFTCEAWIYLNSYTGQNQFIIGRADNASTSGGWDLSITASGQVGIIYGSGSSFTNFSSYQSVPLKRWVHVAGVVSSTASKTGAVYIDGVAVPSTSTTSSATALVQPTVPLAIGAASATPANTYFDGYIAEARVWSVAQTQTQILNNMNVSLVGNEANLVALFQGNGNFNDKTANANNLTSAGGATALNASNPMNAIEWFISTKVTKSGADTLVNGITPTGTGLPNATLGAVSSSSARSPYGFPTSRARWIIDFIYKTSFTRNTPTAQTWYQIPGWQLNVPTGDWNASISMGVETSRGTSGDLFVQGAMSTSTSALDPAIEVRGAVGMYPISGNIKGVVHVSNTPISFSTQTPVYGLHSSFYAVDAIIVNSTEAGAYMRAECAYL